MKIAIFPPKYETGLLTTPDGESVMAYLQIGGQAASVVVIPGINDALALVTDNSTRLARFYRKRAQNQRLLILSRRQPIPEDFSVEKHAEDFVWAVKQLDWGPAVWECCSAGGPAGLWVALKQPEMVKGLILSNAFHRTGEHTRLVLENWLEMIDQERWGDFAWNYIEMTYRQQAVNRNRLLKPLLRLNDEPNYPKRLKNLLSELIDIDQRNMLPNINAPTLVIGGLEDKVAPAEIQREMGDLITNARIRLFPGYGHNHDQENPAYTAQVNKFISRVMAAGEVII
jgi:pimeloyl-ACP methyl ester carboxylesterase